MAEKLDSFRFSRDRTDEYVQWMDGGIYRLKLGEDIPEKHAAALTALRRSAAKAGMKIRTATDGSEHIVIQAYSESEGSNDG